MYGFIKKFGIKALIISLWILIWYEIHILIDSKILMAGPKETAVSLKAIFLSDGFFPIIINSSLSILQGLFMAVLLSILLSVSAYNLSFLREFLKPLILLMKSIPVACFVILALLWVGSDRLSTLVVFIITFPILYSQLLDGFSHIDNDMLNMAKDFRLTFIQKTIYVYTPSIYNVFLTAISLSVGMSFKAGIAAEVIGQPTHSIGEELYFAKLYLESGTLFAWTFIILLLSGISEKLIILFLSVIKRLFSHLCITKISGNNKISSDTSDLIPINTTKKGQITLQNISKTYNNISIFHNFNATISSGDITAIVGTSGSGKTTLINIISKKISPDSGEVILESDNLSVLYQDTQLLEYANGIFNVSLVQNHIPKKSIRHNNSYEMLSELLSENDFQKPVKSMSGGMKRRIEIARACATDSDIILLDEPFRGLDTENRKKVAMFIKKYQRKRTVIVTVHSDEEAELFNPASTIHL